MKLTYLSPIERAAIEIKICGNCPLSYCIHDRYGAECSCLFLYVLEDRNVARLEKIEAALRKPMKIKALAEATGINKYTIESLARSDILIADQVPDCDRDHRVKAEYLIKAVNWPEEWDANGNG